MALRDIVGDDPYPYGIKANVKALEALIQFAVDQHIIPGKVSPEELFAPGALEIE